MCVCVCACVSVFMYVGVRIWREEECDVNSLTISWYKCTPVSKDGMLEAFTNRFIPEILNTTSMFYSFLMSVS